MQPTLRSVARRIAAYTEAALLETDLITMAHREQRGASVTKAWRGVRRIGGNPQRKLSRLRRVMRVGVEATAGNTRLYRVQNITHRSDLASLCVSNYVIRED